MTVADLIHERLNDVEAFETAVDGQADAIVVGQIQVHVRDGVAVAQFLRGLHAEAEALLQGAYAGLKTDWAALEGHEQWAAKFDAAVVKVSGGEADKLVALRSTVQPLVSENRALLAPNAAVGRTLLEFRDAWRDLRQHLDALVELAKPTESISGPPHADGGLERVQGVLAGWQSAKRQLNPWCLWRSARDTAIVQGLQGLVISLESGAVPLPAVGDHFEYSYQSWWLKKTIDNDPVLRSFSSADHERRIREFRQADDRFQKLTERYIAATLAGRIPTAAAAVVGADSELGRLRRELQKQRGHTPVRQLIKGLPTLLPKLKPCLLMSPLSVAQYLDAGFAQFDLVVFDEASQIPVWDAVGAIARGKQLVVVGDPKQLPPTNFFNKSTDSDSDGAGPEQVDDLDAGDENFRFRGLVGIGRRFLMDGALAFGLDRTGFVDRLADDVHDAAERPVTHGHRDRLACVGHFLAAHQAFGRVHGDGAHGVLAQVLGDLEHQAVALVLGLERVQDLGQVTVELHVDDGADDLNDFALVAHAEMRTGLYLKGYCANDAAAISRISCVMPAWRALLYSSVRSPISFVALSLAVFIATMRELCSEALASRMCW